MDDNTIIENPPPGAALPGSYAEHSAYPNPQVGRWQTGELGELRVRNGMSDTVVSDQPLMSPAMSVDGLPAPSMTTFANVRGPNLSKLTEGTSLSHEVFSRG